jgi:hypothetical protein
MVDAGLFGSRRYAMLAAIVVVGLTLVGCASLNLFPDRNELAQDQTFKNYHDVVAAYSNIVPGRTRVAELDRLGFDATAQPGAETLSYLGVIERFMPRRSSGFDRLAAPVQSCIAAQQRCSAYVFRPSQLEQERTGSLLFDLLGFDHTTIDRGWTSEVVLLIQDGRVAYKALSGTPHVEGYHEDIGPPQYPGSRDMTVSRSVL